MTSKAEEESFKISDDYTGIGAEYFRHSPQKDDISRLNLRNIDDRGGTLISENDDDDSDSRHNAPFIFEDELVP